MQTAKIGKKKRPSWDLFIVAIIVLWGLRLGGATTTGGGSVSVNVA
jgi:hypothetical protein